MAIGTYKRWLPLACLGLAALSVLAGCSALSAGPDGSLPDVKLTAYAGSDWQAGDLALSLEPEGNCWRLSIVSTCRRPADKLLFDVRFDAAYRATDVTRSALRGKLDLLVSERPGVLALGAVMPAGQQIQPGTVLSATLKPAAGPLRSASGVPTGAAGSVTDLAATDDGVGGCTFAWSYINTGDYDQNSEVNIADITPLAMRMFEPTNDGDRDGLDRILDGDGNGEVNLADITPIGINYTNLVGSYRLYRADGPDPDTAVRTQAAEVQFSAGVRVPDTRLAFSQLLAGDALVSGAYYFVAPYEPASAEEGPPSNVLQYIPTVVLKFRVPPRGNSIPDAGQCQNPSLVLMPAIMGLSEAGAPVIVYTAIEGTSSLLKLAYYTTGGWATEEIGGGDNFSMPRALWLPGTGGPPAPGSGMVVAYDIDQLRVIERRFGEDWAQTGGADVGIGDGAFSRLDLDRDPVTGALGVAHAYTTLGGGSVFYSYTDAGGAWNTQPVYSGQSVGGLSFRFDPGGGDSWLLFTHGSASYTAGIISLDYYLEQARLTGGTWNVTPVPYPDSPLAVDLGFRADGTPQLCCTTARKFTIPVLGYTISLLFDAASGEYGGSSWSFAKPFESALGFDIGFPPTTLTLTLNLATDVAWAKPGELMVSRGSGSVDIDLATQLPTGGGLDSSFRYMRRQTDSHSYYDAGYFSGEAGRSYSWQVNSSGNPVCGYVQGGSINAAEVISGSFEPVGELMFWRP